METLLTVIPQLSGGGAEEVAKLISEHQSKHFRVRTISFAKKSHVDVFGNFQVTKKKGGIFAAVYLVWQLRKILINVKPIGIVSHLTYTNVIVTIAAYIGRFEGKVVLVHHSNSLDIQNKFIESIVKWSYTRNTVVAISDEVLKTLEMKLGKLPSKIVIYNPIAFRNIERIGNTSDTINLLAIGRYVTVKNYPFLLRVMTNLPNNYKLTICGSGDSKQIKALAKVLKLEARVTFLEFLEKDALFEQISLADCVVSTSDFEGEQISLLEAAHSGVPVVGRNVPGLGSTVKKVGGYLVSQKNSEKHFAETVIIATSVGKNALEPSCWSFVHEKDYASHKYCEIFPWQ